MKSLIYLSLSEIVLEEKIFCLTGLKTNCKNREFAILYRLCACGHYFPYLILIQIKRCNFLENSEKYETAQNFRRQKNCLLLLSMLDFLLFTIYGFRD